MQTPIAKISASGYNSAAYTANNKIYIWGSNSENKLGLGIDHKQVSTPTHVTYWAEKSAFVVDRNKGGYRYELQPQSAIKRFATQEPIEKVEKFERVAWGESHGIFLDKKGRVYTCGASLDGRLGLPDKELPAHVKMPTQVTFGLPEPIGYSKAIDVQAGGSFTMTIVRSGDIYTWGEGALGRLGLGFIEETQDTPNQETPYQIENVFDSKSIVSASCGRVFSGVAL